MLSRTIRTPRQFLCPCREAAGGQSTSPMPFPKGTRTPRPLPRSSPAPPPSYYPHSFPTTPLPQRHPQHRTTSSRCSSSRTVQQATTATGMAPRGVAPNSRGPVRPILRGRRPPLRPPPQGAPQRERLCMTKRSLKDHRAQYRLPPARTAVPWHQLLVPVPSPPFLPQRMRPSPSSSYFFLLLFPRSFSF